MRNSLLTLLILFVVTSTSTVLGDDWPQWLGPKRDSIWRESGIVKQFPKDGLKVKWRINVGLGYSGPAVADGKVFLTDYVASKGEISNSPSGRAKLEGVERVLCLDAKTGRVIWKHEYDRPYALSYPSGPRCTPTVDGDRVYTLGGEGNLLCLDASSGKVIWSKDFVKEYKTKTPIWGFCAHPLVDGDLLYCVVGGEGSVAVAFNKKTGAEVWHALSARNQGYCPPTMIEQAGVKQLLIWHPESLNSLNPLTGKSYWEVPLKPGYEMSITAPRKSGDLLFTSGIGSAGALLRLSTQKPAAEVEWRGTPKTAVYCANSTPIIENGVIYGNDCQVGALYGVRLKDGERLWQTFEPTTGGTRRASHGTVYMVKHTNGYYMFSETGDLILAQLSPKGYKEVSRFHVLEPTNECFGRKVVWSHPAFAERCAFARNDKELVCVSLAVEDN